MSRAIQTCVGDGRQGRKRIHVAAPHRTPPSHSHCPSDNIIPSWSWYLGWGGTLSFALSVHTLNFISTNDLAFAVLLLLSFFQSQALIGTQRNNTNFNNSNRFARSGYQFVPLPLPIPPLPSPPPYLSAPDTAMSYLPPYRVVSMTTKSAYRTPLTESTAPHEYYYCFSERRAFPCAEHRVRPSLLWPS